MTLNKDKRSAPRVAFTRGIPVQMLAIDGTWNRTSLMLDAADEGAKLQLKQSIAGLNLKEFFLVLSSTGSCFRHCELAWINGDEVGVRFTKKSVAPSEKSLFRPLRGSTQVEID
jgi:hypothetical protein